MNRNTLESQWTQIRDLLRENFNNLTEEDIRQINGQYDRLVAKLQQKYGYTMEEAEQKIRNLNIDRFASTAGARGQPLREDRYVRREEDLRREERGNSSILKWLLALGIPIILIGAYLLSNRTPETTRSPNFAQEQTIFETPADRAISNNLRSILFSQNINPADLQNVQITTSNGIVTLNGFVPNRQTSNIIENTAQNFAGVRQVNNNLEIR